MKCPSKWLVSLFLIFVIPPALGAQNTRSVAVLPFSTHSAENIDYVRQGVGDMLASRISVNEQIRVTGKDAVLSALQGFAGRDLTAADIYTLGKKIGRAHV